MWITSSSVVCAEGRIYRESGSHIPCYPRKNAHRPQQSTTLSTFLLVPNWLAPVGTCQKSCWTDAAWTRIMQPRTARGACSNESPAPRNGGALWEIKARKTKRSENPRKQRRPSRSLLLPVASLSGYSASAAFGLAAANLLILWRLRPAGRRFPVRTVRCVNANRG